MIPLWMIRVCRFGTGRSSMMERPTQRADATMPNMPAKLTRLEVAIIVAALVVLLLSNRPPEPGNAEVRTGIEQAVEIPGTLWQVQADPPQSSPIRAEDFMTPPAAARTPDNSTAEPIPQPRPRLMGMVDARGCDSLKYPNIMYGEITVRWIWNGTKSELCKVCEVKDENGVVTVWSFDGRNDGVIVSPIPADQVPMY